MNVKVSKWYFISRCSFFSPFTNNEVILTGSLTDSFCSEAAESKVWRRRPKIKLRRAIGLCNKGIIPI